MRMLSEAARPLGLANLPPARRRRWGQLRVVATSHWPRHYETLGVPATADRAEIKRAYRRLARHLHPDINAAPDAAAHFQEVSRAFAVLSNDLLRSEYDRARRAWRGRELRGAAAQPGADVCTSLAVGLREAVLGGVRVLAPEVLCVCSACKGSGREPEGGISSSTRGSSGGSGDRCAMCAGQGEVQVSSGGHAPQQGLGRLRLLQRCPACSGRGFPHALACRRCKGEGLARRPRPTRVVVPVGVETGSVLRLLGQGDLGRPPGDLVVTVQVQQEEGGITRQGLDLRSRVFVPLWDAVLGGTATVGTIWGPATLAIPPGTQHGAVLALARAGVQPLGGQPYERGAHLFEVGITLPPVGAGDEERRLLERLAALQVQPCTG